MSRALRPSFLAGASALAAGPVMVAVQAERIGWEYPDRTIDVVGAVAGSTRAVVVPDPVLEADVWVRGIAVRGGLGGGRPGGRRPGRWNRDDLQVGRGRPRGRGRGGGWRRGRWRCAARRGGDRTGRCRHGSNHGSCLGGWRRGGQRADSRHEHYQARQGSRDDEPRLPIPGSAAAGRRRRWWRWPPRSGWRSSALSGWRRLLRGWFPAPALAGRLRRHDFSLLDACPETGRKRLRRRTRLVADS